MQTDAIKRAEMSDVLFTAAAFGARCIAISGKVCAASEVDRKFRRTLRSFSLLLLMLYKGDVRLLVGSGESLIKKHQCRFFFFLSPTMEPSDLVSTIEGICYPQRIEPNLFIYRMTLYDSHRHS